jgi:molybdopterin-guanine dinucleotide biosynthesis protein A
MNAFTPLYGLILAGGESRRMGSPKVALHYHGVSELERMHRLLSDACAGVYVGCREDQLATLPEDYRPVSDLPAFAGNGPIGSLLSAWTVFPDVDWLVIGCDYPCFGADALGQLLQAYPESPNWTGFCDPASGKPEPLLGIYRQPVRPEVFRAFDQGERSLRRILEQMGLPMLIPQDRRWIHSVDTPEDYRQTLQSLQA